MSGAGSSRAATRAAGPGRAARPGRAAEGGRQRPTALITGASSGIGEALAERFAGAGHDVVLVARNAGKLKALASGLAARHEVRVIVEPADLSVPGAAAGLLAGLKRRRLQVDVLVNNAGVLEQGAFTGIAPERHQQIIDLNIGGLTAMLAHFVPPMVERGRGRVLNVASIAAFQPVPSLATYAASKAFVLSLSESLAEELRGSGVSVTALCPGITATAMLDRATDANSRLNKLPAFVVGSVDQVADEAFDACMRGEAIRVPGALNLATVVASRAAPKWVVRALGGAMTRAAL